jgi:hypothetical protein
MKRRELLGILGTAALKVRTFYRRTNASTSVCRRRSSRVSGTSRASTTGRDTRAQGRGIVNAS